MWYNQTKGLPDAVVATAIHEVGPGLDSRGVKMEDRAVILWDEKDGKSPTYEAGYLFAAPAAVGLLRLDPLMVPINGKPKPYTVKMMGYIGEPGGYSPKGYERTPLPNRLYAYRLTPMETAPPPAKADLIIRPIFNG